MNPTGGAASRFGDALDDEVEVWKAVARSHAVRASSPAGQRTASWSPARQQQVRRVAWAFVACTAVVAAALLPRSPLLLVTIALVALTAARAAREARKERLDVRSGVARQANAARAALIAGRPGQAAAVAQAALRRALSSARRSELWTTVAWAAIANRDPLLAHIALRRLPVSELGVHTVASYLACCNRSAEALALLHDARSLGLRSRETTKLFIELLFARGDTGHARAVARSDAELLSERERALVESALADASAAV